MEDPIRTSEQHEPQQAVVKRRWAILPGTGAAVVAVATVIALGDPVDQDDQTRDPIGGDSQISAEA